MEVYSYAMMCETQGFASYKVDGCDVHRSRLDEAVRGIYPVTPESRFAIDDYRLRAGLAHHLLIDGWQRIIVDESVRRKTRFFHHDISIERLPQSYDVIVCTNVLGQPQLGGVREAMVNMLRSLKEGGVVVQNYGYWTCGDEQLLRRVNWEVQDKVGVLIPPSAPE